MEAIESENSVWIMKPTKLSRGRGIQLFTKKNIKPEKECVVSRLLTNASLSN
jgi:hypothetical protein